MSIDIFYASGLVFLITLAKPLGHTATFLLLKTEAIRHHIGLYGLKGHQDP